MKNPALDTLKVSRGSDGQWRVRTYFGDVVGFGPTREAAIAAIRVEYRDCKVVG